MVLRCLANQMTPIARGFSTSTPNFGYSHSYRGVVGSNLPFQIENRYRLLFNAILFFGSGLGLPFLCLRHMVKAKNS